MMTNDEIEIDLLRIFKALWKKAWAIVLVAVIFGAVMFTYGKYTFVPQYTAKTILFAGYQNSREFSFGENTGNISQNSLSDSRNLVSTCTTLLKTRMLQEEVIQEAGLNISCEQLASMITAEAVDKTEIFTVKVTAYDPEEAALIANTVGKILPEKAALINPNNYVGIIDTALVPVSHDGSNIIRNTAIAAFLGAFSVCFIVAMKEIVVQWKEQKEKK